MNNRSKPGIVGHRCAGYLAPENTLGAIYTALRMGLEGIECDLQVTADGEIVLFHDTTLNRTTDSVGPLLDHSFDTLQSLDAGSWFDYIYKGERIPTLQQALELIDGRLTAFLEIKQPSGIDRVADVIEECRAAAWCTIISFSEYVLTQCAKRLPDVPRVILIQPDSRPDPVDLINHITAIPADMVGLAPRWLDSDLVKKLRLAGIRIMTGPIDTVAQCEESFPVGPDFIITNQPDILLRFAASHSST